MYTRGKGSDKKTNDYGVKIGSKTATPVKEIFPDGGKLNQMGVLP